MLLGIVIQINQSAWDLAESNRKFRGPLSPVGERDPGPERDIAMKCNAIIRDESETNIFDGAHRGTDSGIHRTTLIKFGLDSAFFDLLSKLFV